ncbi:MAG: flagellar basal body L-ring protein FlgH [Planctomycetota bacterium]|nr:flagellar basal body L-ring protein FlgH [Planctomycetota bacterium]
MIRSSTPRAPRAPRAIHAALALSCAAGAAAAQSLYETPAPPSAGTRGVPAPVSAEPADPNAVATVSLYSVEPPRPREFQAEGLITIIVSERSQFDRKQKGESSKDYENSFAFEKFLDLESLLELRVKPTSDARLPAIDIESGSDFEGEGKYRREDRLTDRITAKILEVKPNGTLVLEARREVKTDEEGAVVVLSGICRSEDVTATNTVQSNQIFDLKLIAENTGDLDRSTRKGLIPRVLEGLFNF